MIKHTPLVLARNLERRFLARRAAPVTLTLGSLLFVGLGAAAATAGEFPDAATILDRFVAVTGGAEAYGKIQNRVAKERVVHVGMGFEDRLVRYDARPNKRYVSLESDAFGPIKFGVDGQLVWYLAENTGPVLEQGEARDAALAAAAFDQVAQWRKYYPEAKCIGQETVADQVCYKVILTPHVGKPETRFYAKQSGLLVKAVLNRLTSVGMNPTIPTAVLLEDYRRVDGLLIPHKMTRVVDMCGSKHETVFVTERIEHNVKLPPDRFTPPQEIRDRVKQLADGTAQPAAQRGSCGR